MDWKRVCGSRLKCQRIGVGDEWLDGFLSDMGFWDGALTPEQALAIYNLAVFEELAYNQSDAKTLFDIYSQDLEDATIGDLVWEDVGPGSFSGPPGTVLALGDGTYGLILNADGSGVYGASAYVIPEPGTMCLLGLGLAALARRRRR